MKKKVLFVTYQPACANNFVAIAEIFRRSQAEIIVVAIDSAKDFWLRSGFSLINNSDRLSEKDISGILVREKPGIIIAGTSIDNNIEYDFVRAAKEMGIKTVSFVDFWNKYSERFNFRNKILFPDRIFVVDTIMHREMVRLGFPPDIIKIVGSPHLENIGKDSGHFRGGKGEAGRIKIAFFSQPISELYGYGQNDENWLGYNEKTIVEILIDCIDRVFKKEKVKVDFIINLHPREGDSKFLRDTLTNYKSRCPINSLSIEIVKMDSRKLINEADIVFGMTSIVLLEAVILGKTTFSLQINSNHRFKFVCTEHKMIEGIFDKNVLLNRLSGLYPKEKLQTYKIQRRPLEYLYKNASERFYNACCELLRIEEACSENWNNS